jgi:hypothetical protein
MWVKSEKIVKNKRLLSLLDSTAVNVKEERGGDIKWR